MTIEEYFNLSQIERAYVWYEVSKHSVNSYETIQDAMERARMDWLCNRRKVVINANFHIATDVLGIYNRIKVKQDEQA